jgi:hypothetical protein
LAKISLPTDVPDAPARDLATLVVGSEQSVFFRRSLVGMELSILRQHNAQSFTSEKSLGIEKRNYQ